MSYWVGGWVGGVGGGYLGCCLDVDTGEELIDELGSRACSCCFVWEEWVGGWVGG